MIDTGHVAHSTREHGKIIKQMAMEELFIQMATGTKVIS